MSKVSNIRGRSGLAGLVRGILLGGLLGVLLVLFMNDNGALPGRLTWIWGGPLAVLGAILGGIFVLAFYGSTEESSDTLAVGPPQFILKRCSRCTSPAVIQVTENSANTVNTTVRPIHFCATHAAEIVSGTAHSPLDFSGPLAIEEYIAEHPALGRASTSSTSSTSNTSSTSSTSATPESIYSPSEELRTRPLALPSSRSGKLSTTQDVTLQLVRVVIHEAFDQQLLVLRERYGTRQLHMTCGTTEAATLSRILQQPPKPRPLTFDSWQASLCALGGQLTEVCIVDLRNTTYFAVLRLAQENRLAEVDCRPTDALALALTCQAPIRISPQVLEQALAL